jgi:mono/diheme cytochrome c family protein
MKILSAVVLAGFMLMGAARAQESGEPRRGFAVARAQCATCHAIRRGEQSSSNPAAPPFQSVADIPGMTAMALNHLMHSAHKSMPLIILAPDDQWHLVAYVLSLRSYPNSR